MPQLGFNPDDVPEGERSFELMPPGMYSAQIIDSDLVATKTGSGQILKLTFEIIEGPCARRRVWANLNIVNANAQAQEIAQRDLKHICAAVGHQGMLEDSNQLHFKPLKIRLAVKPDPQWGDKNEIKAYQAMSGRPVTTSQASAPSQPAQAQEPAQRAAAGGARPWGAR